MMQSRIECACLVGKVISIGKQRSRHRIPHLGSSHNKSGSKALRKRPWNIHHVSVVFCRIVTVWNGGKILCNSEAHSKMNPIETVPMIDRLTTLSWCLRFFNFSSPIYGPNTSNQIIPKMLAVLKARPNLWLWIKMNICTCVSSETLELI